MISHLKNKCAPSSSKRWQIRRTGVGLVNGRWRRWQFWPLGHWPGCSARYYRFVCGLLVQLEHRIYMYAYMYLFFGISIHHPSDGYFYFHPPLVGCCLCIVGSISLVVVAHLYVTSRDNSISFSLCLPPLELACGLRAVPRRVKGLAACACRK
jgi:hypothetical protein